jgi:hypothetical protein
VTEGERPLAKRLSIFDRPQVEPAMPPDPEPSVRRWVEAVEDPSTIGLAVEHAETRIYLAPASNDRFTMLERRHDGGSVSTNPRSSSRTTAPSSR